MEHGTASRLLVALSVVMIVACRKNDKTALDEAAAGPAQAPASTRPVDHLGAGELVEGSERAFGLVLPRDVRVESRIVDLVLADANVAPEAVANYVRARVREGTV